jgi:predicted metalloprotease with PDZ domain
VNEVAPYDWTMFLRSRLDSVASNTPDDALHGSGWKLVYNDVPNEALNLEEKISKENHLELSIGLTFSANAAVEDVVYDGPSYKAGIGPGAKIARVNGRKFSAAALKDAIKAAELRTAHIQLTSEYGPDVQLHMVDYHGGLRYPHLVRDDTHPDFLSDILKSLVP